MAGSPAGSSMIDTLILVYCIGGMAVLAFSIGLWVGFKIGVKK